MSQSSEPTPTRPIPARSTLAGSAATPPPPAPPRRRRRWPWVVGSLALLGAGGYAALAATTGSKTPARTTISGVQVGGLTRDEAVSALRKGLQSRAEAPVPVSFGKSQVNLDPTSSGLAVDYPGSVAGLTGFTLNPVDIYDRLTGSVDKDARLLMDHSRLSAALEKAAADVASKPRNAALAITGGKAVVTAGIDGQEADIPATVSAVGDGWLHTDRITGAVKSIEPEVTTAEAEAVKSSVADKILAGPVTVDVDGKTFKVAAAAIAAATRFEAKDGDLAPTYDNGKLVAAVRKAGLAAKVLKKGKDAEVVADGSAFRVEPSVDGLDVDADKVPAAITAAVTADNRTATIPAKAAPAKLTTEEAKKSLPTGVISTFTTNFPNSPDRTHNITLAARALNGTYVAPGEQFSLNKLLGQRTPEKGYRGAPVIYNGRLTKDYGGGISQVSTTLFNAVFFSGAQIDEYHPHSFYISRYPEGREATISWPDVDQKFTNTTAGGILITTNVSPDSITVTFQGKKTWDIEATKGPRVNGRAPQEIVDDSPGCVPQSKGEGFDVTVGRIFKKAGKVVKTEYYTTNYIPEDQVICTNPG